MLKQARTITYYTLLEALRNRLMWLLAVVVVVGIGLSGFLNELAVTESGQIQVALQAAFFRLAAVFLLATFVVTSMVREFNDKGLELVLALPLARAGYLLGKLGGYCALALVPALLFGGLLALYAPPMQAALWTLSLCFELWIIAAVSLLCVFTFSQIMAALSAVMAFYLLTRSITALELMAHDTLNVETLSKRVINFVVDAVSALLPHFDQFTRTDWLVYGSGSWQVLPPLFAQCAIYLSLLTAAAMFDLYRKNI